MFVFLVRFFPQNNASLYSPTTLLETLIYKTNIRDNKYVISRKQNLIKKAQMFKQISRDLIVGDFLIRQSNCSQLSRYQVVEWMKYES